MAECTVHIESECQNLLNKLLLWNKAELQLWIYIIHSIVGFFHWRIHFSAINCTEYEQQSHLRFIENIGEHHVSCPFVKLGILIFFAQLAAQKCDIQLWQDKLTTCEFAKYCWISRNCLTVQIARSDFSRNSLWLNQLK